MSTKAQFIFMRRRLRRRAVHIRTASLGVHGHVAGVTRSTTANAEEAARRRSLDSGK